VAKAKTGKSKVSAKGYEAKGAATFKIDDKHVIGGYCSMPEPDQRSFSGAMASDRLSAIVGNDKKWVNGTRLRYYFFDRDSDGTSVILADGTTEFRSWVGANAQRNVVRNAFKAWKKLGIGLEFEEVDNREDAEIRIGFMAGDGSWSYLGRDILNRGKNLRTMNFGWDLTGRDGSDTALHEIGHTLGMPHEHQNPNSGILWNEEEVYRRLAAPPNNWDRETTFHNIIRKIDPDTVTGSDWDKDSIMHYPFSAGMINAPAEFKTSPLIPDDGLSAHDKAWVQKFYPRLKKKDHIEMRAFEAQMLDLKPGDQFNGVFEPQESRNFTFQTFGDTDMVLVLFEDTDDGPVYLSGDDDGGEDFNAKIKIRLIKGRRYILRARLYFSWDNGKSAVIVF
jgi:hypothetical protein